VQRTRWVTGGWVGGDRGVAERTIFLWLDRAGCAFGPVSCVFRSFGR
jgi:hypothetical protein